jgi:integrase
MYVVDVSAPGEKRQQRRKRGIATKKEAQAKLTELLTSLAQRTYVPPSKVTLAAFLQDEWLPAIRSTVRPSTHNSYGRILRIHVIPKRVGGVQLQAVEPPMLNALYADLLAGGLSERSVQYAATILHRAFRDAVRWGRLARNPADAADPPRPKASERREMRTWSAAEVRTFLAATTADRLAACWRVFVSTGLRRGEVLALTWQDVNLEEAWLSVRRTIVEVEAVGGRAHTWAWSTPKTKKGTRRVSLDPETVAALRAHRARQLAERLALGEGYATGLGLVFCKIDGDVMHPKALSYFFDQAVKKASVTPISLHSARHTWASLALAAGIHPRVVQERLGHSTISVTLDTYSHVTMTMQADAADKVAALFGEGTTA